MFYAREQDGTAEIDQSEPRISFYDISVSHNGIQMHTLIIGSQVNIFTIIYIRMDTPSPPYTHTPTPTDGAHFIVSF